MDLAREYLNMIPGMNDAEKFSSEKQKMIIRRIKVRKVTNQGD